MAAENVAILAIKRCDLFIVELSQRGAGLGIGAGFAYAQGVPIYVMAKTGSEISETMADLATNIVFYDNLAELPQALRTLLR